MRLAMKADLDEAIVVRKRKADEKYANNVRKKAKHAALRDHAETILSTSLVTSVAALDIQLKARCASVAARIHFLKEQFHARVSGETPRLYPGLGAEYRSKFGKLKMTPSDGTATKEAYLRALITAMINEDGDVLANPHYMPKFTEHYIRTLPSLSSEYTNPISSEMKAEFAKIIADSAAPQDDPVYVELHGQYIGKILYDYETRATAKLFRITAIQFNRSFTSSRYSCWEATCEPVVHDPATGDFHVPTAVKVPGSNVILTNALQGYALAEYDNGLEADPTHLPWVQQYIDYFRNVILPKYPSIFLNSPSSAKDCSSTPNKVVNPFTQPTPYPWTTTSSRCCCPISP